MNTLFGNSNLLEPDYPGTFTSEPHRLVMHNDPDDGFGWEVLHPDKCHYGVHYLGDDMLMTTSYDCDVAWHIDAVGINDSHVHAFDEFSFSLYKDRVALLPGIYTMWVHIHLFPDHDSIFGGLDAEGEVEVESQRAIESRSS